METLVTNQQPVAVEQCDTVAAREWFEQAVRDGIIRRGSVKDFPLIQLLARHRLQERERIAAYLRSESDTLPDKAQSHAVGFYSGMVKDGRHATAIREGGAGPRAAAPAGGEQIAESANCSPAVTDHEAVARLIDPRAWSRRDQLLESATATDGDPLGGVIAHDHRQEADRVVRASLETAGKILVLIGGGKAGGERDLYGAAKALVEKLDLIHADPQYESVWTQSQMRFGPYTGPQYAVELSELRAAIDAARAALEPQDQQRGGGK